MPWLKLPCQLTQIWQGGFTPDSTVLYTINRFAAHSLICATFNPSGTWIILVTKHTPWWSPVLQSSPKYMGMQFAARFRWILFVVCRSLQSLFGLLNELLELLKIDPQWLGLDDYRRVEIILADSSTAAKKQSNGIDVAEWCQLMSETVTSLYIPGIGSSNMKVSCSNRILTLLYLFIAIMCSKPWDTGST